MENREEIVEEELHLFILWQNARDQEKSILADIKKKFEVLRVFEIQWSREKFSENLTRFYGTNLPPRSGKELHVGTGPFLLVVVKDINPIYDHHETSRGPELVNSNVFLSKCAHRELTGGGHKIHATNSKKEFEHDIVLLLGLNTHDFVRRYGKPSKFTIKLKRDLVGADGWESLAQLFYVLNATITYVVLRNYEPLPEAYYAEEHGDIDILVENYENTNMILRSEPVFSENYRVHKKVRVAEEDVLFDVRYLGDDYYTYDWERQILDRRSMYEGKFYVPSENDHFYSLMYHALVHKPEVKQDYIETLEEFSGIALFNQDDNLVDSGVAIVELARFLARKKYTITTPIDHSVFFNHDNTTRIRHAMWMARPLYYLTKFSKRTLHKLVSRTARGR